MTLSQMLNLPPPTFRKYTLPVMYITKCTNIVQGSAPRALLGVCSLRQLLIRPTQQTLTVGIKTFATLTQRPNLTHHLSYRPHYHNQSPSATPILAKRFYSPLSIDTPALPYEFQDVKKIADTASHQGITLVDVREPAEYVKGHIPSAINIPYNSSPGALGLDPEEFRDVFGFDKPNTDEMLVFYCLGGVRSTAAEGIAATYGYQNRANYVGSYQDWVANKGEEEV